MAKLNYRLPRSESSLRIGKVIKHHRTLTMPQRLQLMVNAKLMTQAEADAAIRRLEKKKPVKS